MIDAVATLSGGFHSPVFDSQKGFRAALRAMARPGSPQPLPPLATPPEPLLATSGALLCALADQDTPVWLDAPLRKGGTVAKWLLFHTSAPVIEDRAAASFAVVAEPAGMPPFESFAIGSADYPDRSATLILQVETLRAGNSFMLAGPGIRWAGRLSARQLPDDFAERMAANHALFPLGVDIILAAPDELSALPRSTRVEAG